MHRVLSVETCRNASSSSEFVTKRLCCSLLLTVAFFTLLGGFLLGRFVAERSSSQARQNLQDISKLIDTLHDNLKKTFQNSSDPSCERFQYLQKCNYAHINNETLQSEISSSLISLNNCFLKN